MNADALGAMPDVRVLEVRLPVHDQTRPDLPAMRQALRAVHMLAVMRCSSACLTKDHRSWGECIKSKGLQISPAINDSYGSRQKSWDKELNGYESAVRQGLEPAGTKQHHVDAAFKEADAA